MALYESVSQRVDLNIDEAKLRYESVANLSYKLTLVILKGAQYQGYSKATFDYTGTQDIFIDYAGRYLKWIKINGKTVSNTIYSHDRITLSQHILLPTNNTVEVYFVNNYSNSGLGIHHFKDTADNQEYTYTQFEPFYAHDCFPCFDQPDLKASLSFTCIACSEWLVVSNEREIKSLPFSKALEEMGSCPEELKQFADGMTLTIFPPTGKISSYLYAFMIGPFDYFEDITPGFPPMRIFIRKTLKKYAETFKDEFFDSLKSAIRYYEDFFGVKFPWNKCDQIYCPEYKFGAMENVGAITYNETRYIFKSTPTISDRTAFVITIIHELAHMWFGDLITMKWWTGLWLNESFATFMSLMCLNYSENKKYKYVDCWTSFLTSKKTTAFNDDQMPTTHSIESDARTTEEAEGNFDGITYGKGASCLRQLWYLMGEESFKEGIRSYFSKYPYQNTTINEFLGEMQIAFAKKGGDLAVFKEQWLMTSGMNELTPILVCEDKKIKSFKVRQEMARYGKNVYRSHALDIGLFDENMKLTEIKKIIINANNETVLTVPVGMDEPEIIFINVNYWTFTKTILDAKSIKATEKKLHLIDNELTRSMIYRSLYDMVKDQKIKPHVYLDVVVNNLKYEISVDVVSQQLSFSQNIVSHFLSEKVKDSYKPAFFKMLTEFANTNKVTDIRIVALSFIPSFASTKEDYVLMKSLITEGVGKADLNMQVPLKIKYSFVVAIYGSSYFVIEEKNAILAAASKDDKTDDAVRLSYACDAASADPKNKEKLWTWYLSKDKKESVDILIASMEAFMQPKQDLKEYSTKFFNDVESVLNDKKQRRFGENFFMFLCPMGESIDLQVSLKKLLSQCKEGDDNKKRLYMKALEENRVIAGAFE